MNQISQAVPSKFNHPCQKATPCCYSPTLEWNDIVSTFGIYVCINESHLLVDFLSACVLFPEQLLDILAIRSTVEICLKTWKDKRPLKQNLPCENVEVNGSISKRCVGAQWGIQGVQVAPPLLTPKK